MPDRNTILGRMSRLLASSRPRWAMMPSGPATHFAEMLLFTASALERAGIGYIVHYGTLLGAARLKAPLPWDEDHDLFVFGVTAEDLRAKLAPVMAEHGFRLVPDATGFFWVREKYWLAASGHLSLEFLPPFVDRVEDIPHWHGGAPHLLESELTPVINLPIYTSHIAAPAGTEAILARIYGESGTVETMAAFTAPPMHREAAEFWARARTPDRLDWEAISRRFRARSRLKPLLYVPWWWFNGGYIIWINRFRRWATARRARSA